MQRSRWNYALKPIFGIFIEIHLSLKLGSNAKHIKGLEPRKVTSKFVHRELT